MASDIVGIGKLAESIELATREFRELFSLFCKPSMEQLGLWGGEWLHIQREQHLAKIFLKAKAKLDNAGLQINPVQLKLLKAIVEAGSLEDDDDMCEKWANLLAAAASGDSVNPLYIQTLATLSSSQARLLDCLHRAKHPVSDLPYQIIPQISNSDLASMLKMPVDEYNNCVLCLHQLGLIAHPPPENDLGIAFHPITVQ
jgi:hypothetical protein